ncbi:MAG: holo-ACP synthase [Chloroflexota bacterium]
MIYGIGIDIVEVDRIRQSVISYGERFLARIFTDAERSYCDSYGEKSALHYAARFAAKEAFSKAIGTGITKGFKFKDFSIANEAGGKPYAILEGETREKYGALKCHVTLSHTEINAAAYVTLERLP